MTSTTMTTTSRTPPTIPLTRRAKLRADSPMLQARPKPMTARAVLTMTRPAAGARASTVRVTTMAQPTAAVRQIGRASWREREERAVGGGAREKKGEVRDGEKQCLYIERIEWHS